VYKITVDDHNTSQVREWRWHDVSWPDLSEHPEMQALDEQKQQKIEGQLEGDEEEQTPDPSQVEREQKIQIAQRMRDAGATMSDIADAVDMSTSWVGKYTEKPVEA